MISDCQKITSSPGERDQEFATWVLLFYAAQSRFQVNNRFIAFPL
jgi:hypothetical protein